MLKALKKKREEEALVKVVMRIQRMFRGSRIRKIFAGLIKLRSRALKLIRFKLKYPLVRWLSRFRLKKLQLKSANLLQRIMKGYL